MGRGETGQRLKGKGALLSTVKSRKHNTKKRVWIIVFAVIFASVTAFLLYTEQYYHADAAARNALISDDAVHVTSTGYGWFFDGPSETDALIFYPGAKVEETAYAPLLRLIAEQGMDVCLIKVPFRLAFFGTNIADRVIREYDYNSWYIGGHSLGGVVAADYASRHIEELSGVVLLASYSVKPLNDCRHVITIYGSEDKILNMAAMRDEARNLPADCEQHVIEGGNHAQFGNYGKQNGDGDALISAEDQQRTTAELIFFRSL